MFISISDLSVHENGVLYMLSDLLEYLLGKKVHSGDTFKINNIRRFDAEDYRCVAYNYVPGSANDDVTVTVLFPPSDVVIQELHGGMLSCRAKSGSFPHPVYSWIYPNCKLQKSVE